MPGDNSQNGPVSSMLVRFDSNPWLPFDIAEFATRTRRSRNKAAIHLIEVGLELEARKADAVKTQQKMEDFEKRLKVQPETNVVDLHEDGRQF
ncbi:hypothetical protein [Actinomycetospora sp. CA-053990]|uniref:hypothetical protein n=1 Tax=Actinomycetospora sp. CA-053990 TaxID=3239891 RepID=UPI003D93F332